MRDLMNFETERDQFSIFFECLPNEKKLKSMKFAGLLKFMLAMGKMKDRIN
jgi:hypothetical protein